MEEAIGLVAAWDVEASGDAAVVEAARVGEYIRPEVVAKLQLQQEQEEAGAVMSSPEPVQASPAAAHAYGHGAPETRTHSPPPRQQAAFSLQQSSPLQRQHVPSYALLTSAAKARYQKE